MLDRVGKCAVSFKLNIVSVLYVVHCGGPVKAFEIVCLTLLFIGCFLIAEFFVDHLLLESPFQRFVARIGFQLQLYGLVYLLFDSHDLARRLRKLEELMNDKVKECDGTPSAKVEG